MVRARVPRADVDGRRYGVASRWWGTGTDGKPLEIDVIAAAVDDPDAVLVGEAKLALAEADHERSLAALAARAARCPALNAKKIQPVLWVLDGAGAADVVAHG